MLDGPGTVPATRLEELVPIFALPHGLLLDVGADSEAGNVVGVVEIVFEVELVEVQRDDEVRHGGREIGRAGEGNHEVGSERTLSVSKGIMRGQ